MLVSLIGSNGLLSSCIGLYCNQNGIDVDVFGKTAPQYHPYRNFNKIDLLADKLNYEQLCNSDLIIYTAGAGIQFHLKENKDTVYNLNVTIPVSICNHLKDIGYKGEIITFGSYFEIGETDGDKPFSELDILNSQLVAPNDYAISKRMLSRFFSSWQAPFGFLHFVLPTIYGEHESNYRLIPYTLKSITENIELKLTSGVQVRQYIYIHDVVNVLFNAVQQNVPSGIYNVAGVEEFSVKELVGMLFELTGKVMPSGIFGKTERVDIGMKVLKLDGEKLKTHIDYEPATKIADIYKKYNF